MFLPGENLSKYDGLTEEKYDGSKRMSREVTVGTCDKGHLIYVCEVCGERRIWGQINIDGPVYRGTKLDEPETRRAMLNCRKCGKVAWHKFDRVAVKRTTPVPRVG